MIKTTIAALAIVLAINCVSSLPTKESVGEELCAKLKDHLSDVCYRDGMDNVDCLRCKLSIGIYNAACSASTGSLEQTCQEAQPEAVKSVLPASDGVAEDLCDKLKGHLGDYCYRDGMNKLDCFRCRLSVGIYNGVCKSLTGSLEQPCNAAEGKVAREFDPVAACKALGQHLSNVCYGEDLSATTCNNCIGSVILYNAVCGAINGQLENPPCDA